MVPGRPFLRRLINLTIGCDTSLSLQVQPHHTRSQGRNLKTWLIFLRAFNGKSLMLPPYWLQSPSTDLYTDASGTLGYGAVLGPQRLFGRWGDEWRGQSVTLLEFYPIVVAVSVCADSRLSNKCISFHSDNRAVVDIVDSQTSKDTKVMHLMRKLVHPLPSSSHHWHKQQLGRLSISTAGEKVPSIGAKGLSLSCQHPLSPSIAALTRHAEQLLASALAPGTQAAYKRSWSMFGKFCNTHKPMSVTEFSKHGPDTWTRYSPNFSVSAGIVYLTSS